jgi:methyltransferase (TIGR00027 family)
MQTGQPSRTARAAAAYRAAHQILEGGRLFKDALAVRILGEDADTIAREAEAHPAGKRMRLFIAIRQRFAEDALAAAVARGVRQLVVLGAGLDTFAYRSPFGDRLSVFEVDHPNTQAWKRQCLAEAGISLPAWLTFTPVDFERQTLADGLESAGFDGTRPSFFTWLGVVPYLAEETVWGTLAFIAGLRGGARVVFDYSDPPDSLPPEMREAHDYRAAHVASIGEPWLSYFQPEELHRKLKSLGFTEIEDLNPSAIAARYFPSRAGTAPAAGGHIIRAAKN